MLDQLRGRARLRKAHPVVAIEELASGSTVEHGRNPEGHTR